MDVRKQHTAGFGVVISPLPPPSPGSWLWSREPEAGENCTTCRLRRENGGSQGPAPSCLPLSDVAVTVAPPPPPPSPFENKHINRIDYLIGPWAAGSGLHLEPISLLSHTYCLGLFTSTNQRLASPP